MDRTVEQKSFHFAMRIVGLYRYLTETKKEFILSKQLMRSGTSIGANVAEAEQAQSRADFVAKLSIALKETAETNYWLRLLYATGYIQEAEFQSMYSSCVEFGKMLTAIIKSSKQ